MSISSKDDNDIGDTVHYVTPATQSSQSSRSSDSDVTDETTSSRSSSETNYKDDYIHYLLNSRTAEEQVTEDTPSDFKLTYDPDWDDKTLFIIKPCAIQFEDVVVNKINSSGFYILAKKKIKLSPEQASDLFSKLYGQSSYPYLVLSMSLGPIIVFCLGGHKVHQYWSDMIGKDGLLHSSWFESDWFRNKYGHVTSIEDALYVSQNLEDACKEIKYFFPKIIIEPLATSEDLINDYMYLHIFPTLSKGLTATTLEKPEEPLLYLADWLLTYNPNRPQIKEPTETSYKEK